MLQESNKIMKKQQKAQDFLSKIFTLFGLYPATDDMKMIEPPPRFRINGAASLASKNEALTLTSNILSHTFSLQSRTGPAIGFVAALETIISKPPNLLTVSRNKFARSAASLT